jgi:hypothetical protein
MASISRVTAVLAMCCLTAALMAQSPDTAPNVLFTASGTFSSPAVSGNDLYELAGEPFTVTVIANSATAPHAHGKGWADYTHLRLKGQVYSNLDPSAIPLNSSYTFMVLALGNPDYQVFEIQAPVVVIRQNITIKATIQMPTGTLGKGWLIHPFNNAVTLTPSNSVVSYTGNVNGQPETTTLTVATGTLNATYPTPPGPAAITSIVFPHLIP